MLAYIHVVVSSQQTMVALNSTQVIQKIKLECHSLPYINSIPLTRNLYKLKSLATVHKSLLQLKHKRGREYTHKSNTQQHNAREKIISALSHKDTRTT
jgi:hypothetical protein